MYVLLSFAPVGVLSLVFEVWHHFHARGRRIPVQEKFLRTPGESCRIKMEELNDKISENNLWIFGFPSTLLVCFLSSTGTGPMSHPLLGVWAVAFFLAATAFSVLIWKRIRLIKERNNWRLGFSGERAVGEQLNQLMCDGCRVFHDFPLAEDWNIDHIVIAPSGVYAVETKTKRKGADSPSQQSHQVIYDGKTLEYPFHTDTRDLTQARDQATRLEKFLKESLGESLPVQPILTLPGWYVIARGLGDVTVLNPKMIDAAILAPTTPALSPDRIKQIARLLDQKCRDLDF